MNIIEKDISLNIPDQIGEIKEDDQCSDNLILPIMESSITSNTS